MNEYSLKELLEEAHRIDFAGFDNVPSHRFSLRHRRKMKKIFKTSRRKSEALKGFQESSAHMPLRWKTILIFLLMIFLAIMTAAISVLKLEGFHGIVYPDHVHMYANDDRSAPKNIEEIYYLEALPEDYECTDSYDDIDNGFILRVYSSPNKNNIVFQQYTKGEFNTQYDNEHSEIIPMKINGFNGFIWKAKDPEDNFKAVVWDNGDYIFEITVNMSESEAIELAKSTKIL